MSKIAVVVDLGHFKAYRFSEGNAIELLESYDTLDAHGKLCDKLSDAEGSFGRGERAGSAAMGSGESHNLETEMEKKAVRFMAKDIDTLITREGTNQWYLAAPERINNQIVENLNPAVKAALVKNVKADLTNAEKLDILRRFE